MKCGTRPRRPLLLSLPITAPSRPLYCGPAFFYPKSNLASGMSNHQKVEEPLQSKRSRAGHPKHPDLLPNVSCTMLDLGPYLKGGKHD